VALEKFQEPLLILVIVLFLLGGKKLPEIASGLGMPVRESNTRLRCLSPSGGGPQPPRTLGRG
jgi:mttA/Hcf106 family